MTSEKGSPIKVLQGLTEIPNLLAIAAIVYMVVAVALGHGSYGSGKYPLYLQVIDGIGFYLGFFATWWVGFYAIYVWLRKFCKTDQSRLLLLALWVSLAVLIIITFVFPIFYWGSSLFD